MNYRRKGLRALGLSFLAALGLMAFMAAGAQANWLILHGGKTVELKAPVAASAHTEGNLKVTDAFNTEILCNTIGAQELFLNEKSTLASGKVQFSGCKTWQLTKEGNKEQPKCKPVEPITAGGTAHLVLHKTEVAKETFSTINYVLFVPVTGKPFAVVEFGEECALGEEVAVTGQLGAECGHLKVTELENKEVHKEFVRLDCANHQVTGLLRPNQGLLGDALKFGANNASLTGSASVSLSGELFNGDAFGGHV
jgi:hypothetical protein